MEPSQSKISRALAQLQAKGEGAFVPFVTLGDPDFNQSLAICRALIKGGADALELGFPFSDPLLDGPVIQAANQRALRSGNSTKQAFELLAAIRAESQIPVSLLLCANLIYQYGLDAFYAKCAKVGVDAVLVADVPVFAADDFVAAATKHGVDPVFILPPNGDQAKVQQICQQSKGYIYLVSRAGVTSAENRSEASNLASQVQAAAQHGGAPVLQGFGISSPEQVKHALAHNGVAGVISGSAVVKIVAQHLENPQLMLEKLEEFTRAMKAATKE